MNSKKDAAGKKKSEIVDAEGTLLDIRNDIDQLDNQLLSLLAERRAKSRKAAELKYSGHSPLRDKAREENLLTKRVEQAKEKNLDGHLVTRVFHEILDDSIRYQQQFLQKKINEDEDLDLIKVSFQGSKGSYSHLVAEQYFSRMEQPAVYNGCTTFRETFDLVERGEVDYAVVPLENSTSGGFNEVYDLMQKTRLSIVGEDKWKISPCLLGLEGSKFGEIDRVYGHPLLILQCSDLLSEMQCAVQNSLNVGATIEDVRKENNLNAAIVGSEESAKLLGLEVLKRDIANQKESVTRFLVVSREKIKVDPRISCKTSLVMSTAQRAGSLVAALQVFRDNEISMTKLESRPVIGNPQEQMFYVDFEGNTESDIVKHVVEEIRKHTKFLKVLGSYPSPDISRAKAKTDSEYNNASGLKSPGFPRAKTPSLAKSSKKSASYKLGSREYKQEDTVLDINGVKLGGDSFIMIAGPCSVESEEQIMQCAKHLREHGGHILRGGCFKPRTSPYSFQGMRYEGLDILVKAGDTYDFSVITEVLAVEDVHKVAEKAHVLQIGARNMQNFTLLQEVGRTQRPVMLKRGMSSSIDDLLNAAEYILSEGNQQVFLCERGIRTFETATRNTLDLSAVPVLRQRTHLPIIVDPSHAAGDRELIVPLVFAAKAVGAHGVMVEFHPNPEEALSDGPQALRFPQFAELMADLR